MLPNANLKKSSVNSVTFPFKTEMKPVRIKLGVDCDALKK